MQQVFDYQHLGFSQALTPRFWATVADKTLHHTASFGIETQNNGLDIFCSQNGVLEIASAKTRTMEDRFVQLMSGMTTIAYILLSQSHNSLSVAVAAPTTQFRDDAVEKIRKAYPLMKVPEGHSKFDFWYWTQSDGACVYSTPLEVFNWDTVSENYVPQVREKIDGLVSPDFVPGLGGQFILFQGEGGTGKTVATGSIVKAWESWCKPIYITDPEEFFNNTGYMLHIFLEASQWGDPEKWSLVILEDAGELVAYDAKARTGAALSRFLNLTNGLLGKGFKTLFLITTNEELKDLHKAVSRPGRCAARIDFGRFSAAQGTEWLASHGIDEKLSKEHTLAELYAKVKNFSNIQIERKNTIGFGI